jgi:serine protease Do
MGRYQSSFRLFLSVAAIVVVAVGTSGLPALADDVAANKSGLISGLLPTVVNISVSKVEPVTPPPAATPAVDAPVEQATKPSGDNSTTVKDYVGSGFVIDPSGLIVTNYHVVEGAFEITVTFSNGNRLKGETLSASRLADLALVKVNAGHPLPAAHWGDSDALQVGDQVFAAGNPFGLGISVSTGIVSALNRDIQNSPYDDLIQTDAPINHGNSGGPLFDMQGNVVGVDSVIISPTTGSVGLGFAIPSSSARFVIEQLRRYGWVRPGWIGVKLQQVTPDIADAMGMAQPEGSIVAWVLADGPAHQGGLGIGDVVLRFGSKAPTDERALLREIAHTPVGTTTTLLVRHGAEERTIPITVAEWPRNQWDVRDAPVATPRPKIPTPPDLGLTLGPVPDDAKAKLGLQADLTGVLVTAVAPDSDPARRGMVGGDIILRVQQKPVVTPEDVRAAVDAARTSKRDFVLMLILPKVRDIPGPKWVALQLMNRTN